jgi:ankyrin repeat protein
MAVAESKSNALLLIAVLTWGFITPGLVPHAAASQEPPVNDTGDTAVHGAVQRGSEAVIRFLAGHGARLDVKNKQGRTPLDVASARREHAGTAALLGQTVCQPKETAC